MRPKGALSGTETPMMRQFNAIKREHPDKILFFRMGDFYEMFGDDAIGAAKILQIALTSRNKSKEESIPMCGVPYHAYEQYLNKLTAAGCKVAICEQMEDPAQAKGIVDRQVVRVVTPGTTVSPQLIAPDQNHYLISLNPRLNRKRLGVAVVDVSTGEFEVAEFGLSEMNRFYDFIYQLVPQEVLVPKSRSEAETRFFEELKEEVEQLLKRHLQNPYPLSFIEPYYFDSDEAPKLLKSHFETFNLAGFGIEDLEIAIPAAGAMLRYLSETQKCDLRHITTIRQHSFDQFMLLDETTISNLELFHSHSGNPKHTLYGVLNHTRTAMGARLLRQWLRQPLLDVAGIQRRFDAIQEFHTNFILCEELRVQLDQIQDIPRLAGRISLQVVGINDMVGLRSSLIPVSELPSFLQHFQTSLLKGIADQYDPLTDVLELLHTWLLERPDTKLKEGGFIAEGVSEDLDELRNISLNVKTILNNMIQSEREKTGIPSLKVGYNKVFGYYLEVSNAHRQSVPDYYIRKQTLVNAERYITPELKELEEKVVNAEERICEIEYDLFQELKTKVLAHVARIQKTAFDIATLDVLASLAYAAENSNYLRPTMLPSQETRKLVLRNSRHPVIEQIDFDEPFVPNNVDLDADEQQIMLITGPNMAGKSTYMRQIALNVLMAQCGSYVPASSAEMSVMDRVFTRVGASDNLSRGESTFMVEMNEAASILNNATAESLIILDEIGRGTSTFDGISIAWAIVEHLHQRRPLTLCATHYHELTVIAQQLNRVKNFNILVKEEADKIVFMRKIVSGEADRSYGVHVAKLAGLPKTVVDRAMDVMAELESSSLETHLPKKLNGVQSTSNEVTGSTEERASKKNQKGNGSSHVSESSPEYGPMQLSLFPEESPYIQELKDLNIMNMTPMQALNYLHDLITRIKN